MDTVSNMSDPCEDDPKEINKNINNLIKENEMELESGVYSDLEPLLEE